MSLKDKKYIGAMFEKDAEVIRVTYDFAKDTGAQADYDVLEAQGNCIVRFEYAIGRTSVVGSTANLDLGKADGGTEFWSDADGPSIAADAFDYSDTVGTCVELTDGEKIVLGIENADLTAGVFDMVFTIFKKR